MNQKPETKEISISLADNSQLQIEDTYVVIKDLLKMTEEGILLKNTDIINGNGNFEVWANLSIGNIDLSEFGNRTKTIKNILSIAMKNNIKGINVIATNNNPNLERFIIELAPVLRELGIKTNIVKNEFTSSINYDNFTEIVDYIIK